MVARSTDLKAAASAEPPAASTLAAAAPLLLLILVDAIGFAMLTPLLASALADGSDAGISQGVEPVVPVDEEDGLLRRVPRRCAIPPS